MKLNKDNKHNIKIGDMIRFSCGEAYIITTVIQNGHSVCFTLRDIKSGQYLYCYPSNKCYGAEIIRRA